MIRGFAYNGTCPSFWCQSDEVRILTRPLARENNPTKLLPGIWKSYLLLYRHALKIVEKRLEEHYRQGVGLELRMVWVLLAVEERPSNQRTLAHCLGLDNKQMVKLLDRMEAKHLVKRTPNPESRRENILRLAPEGKKALKWIHQNFDAAAQKVWRPLPVADLNLASEFAYALIAMNYAEQRSSKDEIDFFLNCLPPRRPKVAHG